jgi:hypothetical protein
MKTILVRICAIVALALALTACSGGTPKKEVVAAALKKILPVSFEIQGVSPVKDIPGLYEVLVKADKQPLVLYVNSKASLVFSGSIVEVETKKNLSLEAQKKMTGN